MSQATAGSARSNWRTSIVHYMEMIRFSHTIFALPFALLATAWAFVVPLPDGRSYLGFHWRSLVGIVLCMVLARSFAMAMNRLLDEKWDAANPRTASRHLPAKVLSRAGVAWFSAICAAGFAASCLLFLPNVLPIVLSLPVLAFLTGYSFAKRFTNLVHFWLGAALMLAPICAWIALRGESVWDTPTDLLPAVWLGCVVFLWVSGFDIIYACQDEQFDRSVGLFSIPSWLGVRNALRVAAASHALMWLAAFAMTVWLPSLDLGWLFRIALLIVGGCLIYEHSVVSEKSLARIQLAFFQLNSVISIIFLIVGIVDAYWR